MSLNKAPGKICGIDSSLTDIYCSATQHIIINGCIPQGPNTTEKYNFIWANKNRLWTSVKLVMVPIFVLKLETFKHENLQTLDVVQS